MAFARLKSALKALLPPDFRLALRRAFRLALVALWPLRLVAALPWLLVVMAAAPFRRLRFAHVGEVKHIGWLAQVPEYYLRQWQLTPPPKNYVTIILMYNPGNIDLFNIMCRHLDVVSSIVLNSWANFIAPVMKPLKFFIYDHVNFFDHRRYSTTAPAISLTDEEEQWGRRELEKMGIGPKDWFVCFHARDPSHYQNSFADCRSALFDYRDSAVENMIPAMEEVTRRGGFAVRVGAHVDAPLPDTGNPRMIDYASKFRSPFLDIYLSARCRFFIGNTAGIITVPMLFNTPMAMSNVVPNFTTSMRRQDPFLPKLLRQPDGQIVNFAELHSRKMFEIMDAEKFVHYLRDSRFECIENSAEDILGVCLDMFDIIDGKEADPAARRLQDIYRELLPYPDREYAPSIGARFALSHADLITAGS